MNVRRGSWDSFAGYIRWSQPHPRRYAGPLPRRRQAGGDPRPGRPHGKAQARGPSPPAPAACRNDLERRPTWTGNYAGSA